MNHTGATPQTEIETQNCSVAHHLRISIQHLTSSHVLLMDKIPHPLNVTPAESEGGEIIK